MFGYLRPFKDELKYKDIKEYKKYYCSVCNGLKKQFGVIYAGFLNYEMVYLYLFIEGITKERNVQKYSVRCPLNPFQRFETNINIKLLDYVCFINYYLAVEKIKDNYLDEKNILYKGIHIFLTSRKKYKKKSQEYFVVKKVLDEEMELFSKLEKTPPSFDALASAMGHLLEIIVDFFLKQENIGTVNEREKAQKVSFHLGELIYLLDALEDYYDDLKKKRYNPLIGRTEPDGKNQKDLKRGLIMSNLMVKKIQMLSRDIKFYFHEDLLTNILEVSLRNSVKRIFCEKYSDLKGENMDESSENNK